MAKIYTKSGDEGKTSLIGGSRVLKDELQIEAYGTVDELNAWIGLISDNSVEGSRKDSLRAIQHHLFVIGSCLALEAEQKKEIKLPEITETDVQQLETWIDDMDTQLKVLRHFILPGGHVMVSYAHLARTVCRRAERRVITLQRTISVDMVIVRYLNRLSDYLFVLSRMLSKELNVEEVKWIP